MEGHLGWKRREQDKGWWWWCVCVCVRGEGGIREGTKDVGEDGNKTKGV